MTTLLETGFEAALTGGWSALVGTAITSDAAVHYEGLRSAYMDKGVTAAYLQLNLAAKRVIVGRMYLRIRADPIGTTPCVSCVNASGNLQVSLRNGRKLRAEVGATVGADSPALALDTWYRVDWRFDSSGATATAELKIDGVDAATASRAQAAADMTALRVGGTGTNTVQVYFDAVKVTDAASDYPIGPLAGGLAFTGEPGGAVW